MTDTIDRRRILLQGLALGLTGAAAPAGAQAPAKILRAVWLGGNPVQARQDAAGQLHGPAVDVAQALARRNGVTLDMSSAQGPAAVLDRLKRGEADIAFVAFDPTRADGVTFSPPYLVSLNQFAVRPGVAIAKPEEVDRAGVRVGAVPTDAGGLYLQRTLRNTAVTPMPTVDEGIAALRAGKLDAMAANGQRLADLMASGGGFTILPGSFFGVPQVVAVRSDNPVLAGQAAALVKDMLASGAIAASIKRWNLTGAAPA